MSRNAVLVAAPDMRPEAWRTRLAAELPGRDVHLLGEAFDKAAIRYAATWWHPAGSLSDLPNLEVIFSLGAGVDHVFVDERLPRVPVARVVDPDLTQRMTEWVVLHVLLHHRQQRVYDRQQRDTEWTDDRAQPAAKDVRVGIMGMGELGTDAARKLAMLGFDVAGWSATRKEIAGIRSFAGEAERDAFLARTDILVVILPHTPATHGIIDADLISKLARGGRLGGPYLLNAGRGGLQKEKDILAALDSGALKGASLDVFETEPLPATSPLWSHPLVYVSPHNAAISDHDAIGAAIARQIERLESGGALEHVVERKRGY
ncbi:glyoxylate/hydroxypyruvate reductase A [Rhizobiales bacterium GAS113]|jgi:glyoxylate/hydroxypyruvate reductase A|nr:glyoxylate/hydroxypyruvate reductase A [Rhizobiales bacterium GAS113]